MARTITIKKGGGGAYSPGWHELTISKAKYNEYQGTKCIDIWFEGYPDNFNARVYAKNGKNGEEFAIGQVYRFANAGITGALEGPDKTMMIKIDDSAEALVGCKLNGYFYKDGDYSRCLKQFAPTIFKNEVEEFSENDIIYWKSKAVNYFENYVKDNTNRDNAGAFVSSTESVSTTTTDADTPF
tara:strand:- start:43 stop:594 length:552 start_codon:yes stop_codon:yes gene_type:complete